MAKRTRAKHQGIWGSLDFTSNVRGLGLCAFISMLALPVKSYAVIDPTQLGLDSVANFAVYAGGSLTVNGTTTVNGDVGLGPNGTQNFGTGFTINGTYRVDNTANNSHSYSGGSFTGGTVLQGLQYVSTTVSSVSAYAASLTATLTLSTTLGSNYTVVGNGGYNIISLPGIIYTGNRTLTLQGGANDVFIINVGNNNLSFSGAGATPITLSGVATNHVLFNLLSTSAGANALIVSQPNETLFGTFIAPYASISLAASDKIYGGLFAGGNNLDTQFRDNNGRCFFASGAFQLRSRWHLMPLRLGALVAPTNTALAPRTESSANCFGRQTSTFVARFSLLRAPHTRSPSRQPAGSSQAITACGSLKCPA